MTKSDLLKAIKEFREKQVKEDKATDLLTFIYLLTAEYDENIYLEGKELNKLVLEVLKAFN